MRVLLIDDHAVVRRGIRAILEDAIAGVAVSEADCGDAALDLLGREPFDAAVLDLSMPGRSGLELLGDVKKRCPDLPILVMSLHAEEQFAARTQRAGAAGYLTKSSAPEKLVDALIAIVKTPTKTQ
jgi:DNA-binding NarL/FixJ family response regulator